MPALGCRHLRHEEFSRIACSRNVPETLLPLVVLSLVSRPRHRYDYSSSPKPRFIIVSPCSIFSSRRIAQAESEPKCPIASY
jgi:hypothetical protein